MSLTATITTRIIGPVVRQILEGLWAVGRFILWANGVSLPEKSVLQGLDDALALRTGAAAVKEGAQALLASYQETARQIGVLEDWLSSRDVGRTVEVASTVKDSLVSLGREVPSMTMMAGGF